MNEFSSNFRVPAPQPLQSQETWRPERCDRVALVLQGGGALGAYQAGVYQAMHEARLEPDWVSGVSIGAINSAIIAGNPPNRRLRQLRAFWERITDRKIWPYFPQGAQCDEFLAHDDARAAGIFRAAFSQSLAKPDRRPKRDQLLRHGAVTPNAPGARGFFAH